MVPGQGTPEYEKKKLASIPKELREAKIASAKEAFEKGQIGKHHFDAIAANLK